MQFQWDSGNIEHIALHDVTPEEAEQVLENDPIELHKTERNDELRDVFLGETDTGRVLIVTTTMRGDKIRVVTAYPAKRKSRNFYFSQRE